MRRLRTTIITLLGLGLLWMSGIGQAQDLPDFTKLVEKYQPTVVNISTTRTVKPKVPGVGEGSPFGHRGGPHDPFQDLMKRFFGEPMTPEEYSTKSLGSGFIISADGFILTNNHVIKDADEIIVRLSDSRELEAKLVGADEGTDLALLKVEEKGLPTVKFGSSEALKVGEWVLAIGSPFGFEHSVTAGIVSAKQRGLRTEQYVPFIQTDVAINPGNSGGPLFNLKGQVIGINAQILSRSGGYLGLSFAIPSDVAQKVVSQLQGKGFVSRGWLGVAFQNISRDLAQSFNLESSNGALVAEVVEDSPAAKGGIRQGDIIVKFNGHAIKDATELSPLVGAVNPGTTVNVAVISQGKQKSLKVTIEELSRDKDKAAKDSAEQASSEKHLGIEIRDFTEAERTRYDLGEEGVLIESIEHNSPVQKAGIRRGDILLSLNQQPINKTKDFYNAVKSIGKEQKVIPFLIERRNEGKRYFAVKID